MKRRSWIAGPPPGPGRYWVRWLWDDGARVEPVEISPALIYRNTPGATLQIKTLSGLAFAFVPNIPNLTHHMPLDPPKAPPVNP